MSGVETKNNLENRLIISLSGELLHPDLKLPEEHRPGKYGRMHREYLKRSSSSQIEHVILTGEMWTYLPNLNEQAQ